MNENLVSVVVSTRKINKNFEKEVKRTFPHPNNQILIYENNGEFTLPQIYNKGLDESINDIVIFMHDDLIIETTGVAKKLYSLFESHPEHGIIGIAGTNNLVSGL